LGDLGGLQSVFGLRDQRLAVADRDFLLVFLDLQAARIQLHDPLAFHDHCPFVNDVQDRSAAAPQAAAAPIAASSTTAARAHLAAELDVFGAFDGPLLD